MLFYHQKELDYWQDEQASVCFHKSLYTFRKNNFCSDISSPKCGFGPFLITAHAQDVLLKKVLQMNGCNVQFTRPKMITRDQTGSEQAQNLCHADRLSGYTCWRLFVNHHPAVKKSEPCWSPAWCTLLLKPSALISLWIFEIPSEFLE